MSPIAETFANLRIRGEKALVLFVTAGDPTLEDLPAILETLIEAGADLIEIGIPFSDPIADGPTIQAASQRALDSGVTPAGITDLLAQVQSSAPLVAMGYVNSFLRAGFGAAAATLRRSGFAGTIVSDLIPEESAAWIAASQEQHLDTIFLAAPTSTDARLDKVCGSSTGFVYAVSRTGVTSQTVAVPSESQELVKRLRGRTDLPVCVGFGISKPEHVKMVCEEADGAVIGSWLVDLIAREWNHGAGRSMIYDRIRELKEATRVS